MGIDKNDRKTLGVFEKNSKKYLYSNKLWRFMENKN